MKLLVATPLYPPDIGGPATYSKFLEEELPAHSIQVRVVSFGTVRHLPKLVRHFRYALLLVKEGRSCDVLYAQDPVSVGIPTIFAALWLRKRYILKVVGDYAWEQGMQRFGVHDMLEMFSKKRYGYSMSVLFLKRVQLWVARRALHIIVPSEYLKKIVVNWGVGGEKVSVIYNAFELTEKSVGREAARIKLGIESPMLISAGRLVPWKGFEILVGLMPELLKKRPRLMLFIAGEGPERETLEELIAKHNLEDSVQLLGRVDRKKLFMYIAAADAFVLPTGYEGFSHQLLEVMALQTPIVTTVVGGNKEVITNEREGLLVGYNDVHALRQAIERVLSEHRLAMRLTENAIRSVERFSRERITTQTAQKIETLCAS